MPSELPLSAKAQRLAKEWAQDPQSKVFVPLAEEYARLGMLQRAALVLEEGIGIYPGYVIAMVALGAVYYEMKELGSAKDVLEAAIQSSPENMKAHRVLAQIYAAEGDIEAARRSCTVVLMTNPLDEDIKSLECRLGTAEPVATMTSPSKGTDARRVERPRAASAAKATDAGQDAGAEVSSPATAHAFDASVSVSGQSRRIARLQRWLRRIQTARRTA